MTRRGGDRRKAKVDATRLTLDLTSKLADLRNVLTEMSFLLNTVNPDPDNDPDE